MRGPQTGIGNESLGVLGQACSSLMRLPRERDSRAGPDPFSLEPL